MTGLDRARWLATYKILEASGVVPMQDKDGGWSDHRHPLWQDMRLWWQARCDHRNKHGGMSTDDFEEDRDDLKIHIAKFACGEDDG